MPIPTDALDRIQAALGHRFENRALLEQALKHTSWIEERWPGGEARHHRHESQERLEFLGDAYLTYHLGRRCYERMPLAAPGELTQERSRFARGEWLTKRGREIGFDPELLRGAGERMNAGLNNKVIEDTTEALIGAVLVDAGEAAAGAIIEQWLRDAVAEDAPEAQTTTKDPMIEFHEWHTKEYRRTAPKLTASRTGGPDHAPVFTCVVEVEWRSGVGTGRSGQEAKRAACRAFVDQLAERTA